MLCVHISLCSECSFSKPGEYKGLWSLYAPVETKLKYCTDNYWCFGLNTHTHMHTHSVCVCVFGDIKFVLGNYCTGLCCNIFHIIPQAMQY